MSICGMPTILGGYHNPCTRPAGHEGMHAVVPITPIRGDAQGWVSGRGPWTSMRPAGDHSPESGSLFPRLARSSRASSTAGSVCALHCWATHR